MTDDEIVVVKGAASVNESLRGSTPEETDRAARRIGAAMTGQQSRFGARAPGVWPAWLGELLVTFGPFAELEAEWRAELGDSITAVLDAREAAQDA